MRVRDTMTRHVITVSPEDWLDEAYELMLAQEIRHLPVVDGTVLVGILSDRDILLRSTEEDGAIQVPHVAVGEVMSHDVITCSMGATIGEAANMMIQNRIGAIPVTLAGDLVGMITSTDLLDVLAQSVDSNEARKVIPFSFQLSRYGGRGAAKHSAWI
jgi:acetoin utilization protein AcuB